MMGWPKKNEGYRLYFERKAKSYLLLDPERDPQQTDYSAIGELLIDNDPEHPRLCSCEVSDMHLYRHCRRVSWAELPEVWRRAFLASGIQDYVNDDWVPFDPTSHRGLWRIGERPS